MNIQTIAPIIPMKQQFSNVRSHSLSNIPITSLLELQSILKKTVFSRKFYQEINDKVLSKSSTVDTNLYFICYFTLLLSAILNNKPKIIYWLTKQKYNLLQVIKRVSQSQFSKDLTQTDNKFVNKIFSQQPPVYNDKEKSQLAIHFKAISSYLSDIRIFNRLTDSIKYMPWIIDEYHTYMDPSNSTPKLDRLVNFAQSVNCLVLELLENAGWVTDHNWVGTGYNDWWSFETYIWCSRVWGAYLIIEIIELIRRTPRSKWDSNWKISLFKQVIQVPLVAHWSLREGCLTPFWVGVCGCGASWWNFKDMWKSLEL